MPDLLLQADHLRLDPAVAHSLVRGGVRLDLGPVEGHDPELDEPGLLTPPDDLEEEALEGGEVPLTEVADRPEVRAIVRGEHRKAPSSIHRSAILREDGTLSV